MKRFINIGSAALLGFATISVANVATAQPQDAFPAPFATVDGSIDFPDPDRATRPQGAFVPPDHIARISQGMRKSQLYTLLDVPHFHEGLFGPKKWNYIFNLYTGQGNEYRQCQYQIFFEKRQVSRAYWRDQECADLHARLMAPPEQQVQVVKEVVKEVVPAGPVKPMKTYAINFDFDSAALTGPARSTLDQAAADIAGHSYSRVVVTGGTDTMGSVEYNDVLGARRATAVSQYLGSAVPAGNSISANNIYTRSSRDHVVQTGDEVREVRNRVVVVELYQ